MRKLLIVAAFLFASCAHAQVMQQLIVNTPKPASGGGPGAFVQSKQCSSGANSYTCAFASNTGSSHALGVFECQNAVGATFTTPTDTQSNTYSATGTGLLALSSIQCEIFTTATSSAAADTITIAASSNAGTSSSLIFEVSGIASSSIVDIDNGQEVTAGATPTFTSPTVSTSNANDYLIGLGASVTLATSPYTANASGCSGFTMESGANVGTNITQYYEDENVSTAGSKTACATAAASATSNNNIAWILALKQ